MCVSKQEKWPHFWGHIQEATVWWAMSGKALNVAVPSAGTAIRDMVRRIEESVGHEEFAASLLRRLEALAAPKGRNSVITLTRSHKQMTAKDLSPEIVHGGVVPRK
jgi:hypothetical protein